MKINNLTVILLILRDKKIKKDPEKQINIKKGIKNLDPLHAGSKDAATSTKFPLKP